MNGSLRSVLKACQPRKDLLEGNFNPEIFTANLLQVLEHYRGVPGVLSNLYTDPERFFTEGTYATAGMREVLTNIFGRLAGNDAMYPAIQRLETGFGGGKTHTLIAAIHICMGGKNLAAHTQELLEPSLLPDPGAITVVGIAGERVAIHGTKGTKLTPYTLWGEIAFQVGGEALYRELGEMATSRGSPGDEYYKMVFGGRTVLLMLDEMAAYATRVEAAQAGASSSVGTFLMALMQYAKDHIGLSVVLTLASQKDAFSKQTKALTDWVSKAKGQDIDSATARTVAENASKEVSSVVARDATTVIPVQGTEISRVLARRLFEAIDPAAARDAAEAYLTLYAKTASMLPESANRSDLREKLEAHYPFHPTFIDYLTRKLAAVENFQSTRGVLRMLALTVRNLWQREVNAPMIHACHVDLRDTRVSSELISRTDSAGLLPIVTADIGGADSATLATDDSNAALADKKNPHPLGYPLYEYTWKTVFLHSLSGIGGGLSSANFGISTPEALYAVAFPGLSPSQVEQALKEIPSTAYYLRYSDDTGRYYASLDPSVNKVLAHIRASLKGDERVERILTDTARKVVKPGGMLNFNVVNDVGAPEHIPDKDKTGKPTIALAGLSETEINPETLITQAGPNVPRFQQNLVFVLVPETVVVNGDQRPDDDMLQNQQIRAEELRDQLQGIALDVLARKILAENPQGYGLSPSAISDERYKRETSERGNALITSVTQAYRNLWFPGPNGKIIRRELATAGGEGGVPVIEAIKAILEKEGEIVTAEQANTASAVAAIAKFFFEAKDLRTLNEIRSDFACKRAWPVLAEPSVFDVLIRSGVKRGGWRLFRMGDSADGMPAAFYTLKDDLPISLNLTETDWSVVTPDGAKKRGWDTSGGVDKSTLSRWVEGEIKARGSATVADIVGTIKQDHGADVPESDIMDIIDTMIRSGTLYVHGGQDKPDDAGGLKTSADWVLDKVSPTDHVVTRPEAVKRGWVKVKTETLALSGSDAVAKVWPLVGKLAGLYQSGATSTLDFFELSQLALPNGGTLTLRLEGAGPADIRALDELFDPLADLVSTSKDTDIELEIRSPQDGCALVAKLKGN